MGKAVEIRVSERWQALLEKWVQATGTWAIFWPTC